MGHKPTKLNARKPEPAQPRSKTGRRTIAAETESRRKMVSVVGGKMGEVGRNLELALNHYGLGKLVMAQLVGIDKAVMSRSIHGAREFRASELFLMCQAMGIPMDILFLPSLVDVQHALNAHDAATKTKTKAGRAARQQRA